MKKILILIPVLLSGLAFTGCDKNDKDTITAISYGTYLNEGMRELDFAGLKDKMVGADKGENFILVGAYSKTSGCSCWSNFQAVLNSFIKKNHYVIYTFDKTVIFNSTNEKEAADWGLNLPGNGSSTLYIVNNSKVVKEFNYSASDKFFSDTATFTGEIAKYVSAPQMYYVTPESLDERLLTNKEDAIVHYMWNDCPDCKYCAPIFLVPYAKENDIKKNFYIVDTSVIRDSDPQGKFGEPYVAFNKKWKLSAAGDSTYGYDRGFVPTTQYWSNGQLVDVSVYFNDTVTKDAEGNITISQSFYSESRKANLHYLDNVETPVLEGLKLSRDDVSIFEWEGIEYISWSQSSAAKYHNALLKAFMDKYSK